MTTEGEAALGRQLAQARQEVVQLEAIVEDRSRSLHLAEEELYEAVEFLTRVLEKLESAVIVTSTDGVIARVNGAAVELLGFASEEEAFGTNLARYTHTIDGQGLVELDEFLSGQVEASFARKGGDRRQVLCAGSKLENDEQEVVGYVFVAADVSERKQLEIELRHAQKLESVGQLAAGIAHEINTPIQFVGDSLTFLQEAFSAHQALRAAQQKLVDAASSAGFGAALLSRIKEVEEEIDIEFLDEEVPTSLRRAVDGVNRVAKIVRSMKEFSHPGSDSMAPADLNQAVETTLTVANNEFKYVAELKTDFGDLPLVNCHVGDISQVVLNLMVNAAHAVEDRKALDGAPGLIEVSSRAEGGLAIIEVKDNGTGIPDAVREKVFDPFFTTKAVGKGTGQGLSLAHSVVVDRHGGELRLETAEGKGTSFSICIPMTPEVQRNAA